MIEQSRDYLVNKLQEAGIKTKVYTTLKELKASQESHVGAVLFESDKFERSGSKKVFRDEEGKKKRTKIFNRKTYFSVTIGEYKQEKCEEIFENFMTLVERGTIINGNYIPIEVEEADWIDKEDSILKSKIAVQILIRFDGGIYKDVQFAKVNEVEIENIEMVKEV